MSPAVERVTIQQTTPAPHFLMSSNHNLCTDESTSSIDAAVSTMESKPPKSNQAVVNILSFLSNSIELKLPLSDIDINPEISPALEKIKNETDGVPDDVYNTFRELVKVVESDHSKLQETLSKTKNNEPISSKVFKQMEGSLKLAGITALNELHKSFTENSLDGLDLRIRQVFGEREKKQHQNGQLNAVKDNIVPPISAINPILAPAESAAKVAVGLATHYLSSESDNELKELGITDKRLRQDVLMAIETKLKLEKLQAGADDVKNDWRYVCQMIYTVGRVADTEVNITLRQIELTGECISEFISPIKAYLAQVHPFYASGINIVREAKAFCRTVPKILQNVNIIGSAKMIIRTSHRYKFVNTVNDLGLAIFVFLESMRMVFTQRPMDPTSLEKFVKPQTLKFIRDTNGAIRELHRLLDKHTSKSKSKDAEKKRMAGDRCFDSLEWRNRPPVNPEGVRLQLNRVEAAIGTIHGMSVVPHGKTLETIDGGIERSHVELDVSNPSLDRVHQVLNEDVGEGLKHFKNQQMVEKPSLIQRGLDHMPFHHKER